MIKLILLFFALVSLMAEGTDLGEGVNAAEFMELCRFKGILESQPEAPKVLLDGKAYDAGSRMQGAMDLIDLLNASTVDNTTFEQLKEGSDYEKAEQNPVVKQLGKAAWDRLKDKFKQFSSADSGSYLRLDLPLDPLVRVPVHKQIAKVYREAHTAQVEFDALGNAVSNDIFEARVAMFSAIYGRTVVQEKIKEPEVKENPFGKIVPTAKSFGDGSDGSEYDNICNGGSGANDPAKLAKSIVSDMMCLCAKKNGGRAEAYCGSGRAPGADANNFAASALVGLAKTILGFCKAKNLPQPSPEVLHSITASLKARLGAGAFTVTSAPNNNGHLKNSRFILGFHTLGQGTPKCEGTDADHNTQARGVCVNYAAHLSAGDEIPWVAEIQTAAKKLKESEEKYRQQLTLLAKVENLRGTAELYYETASTSKTHSQAASTHSTGPTSKPSGSAPIHSTEKGEPAAGSVVSYDAGQSSKIALLLLLV